MDEKQIERHRLTKALVRKYRKKAIKLQNMSKQKMTMPEALERVRNDKDDV